jgi:membrane-associated protease RseP (regulator of RpoE activity)
VDPVRLPPEPADPLQPWNPPVVDDLAATRRSWAVPDPQRRRARPWVSITLFVLTIVTTTLAGVLHYVGFIGDFGSTVPHMDLSLVLHGFWYSGTILAILGCHELGHYFACRYYGVDASPPFFLPAPILTGTFGAFIRIREPIRTKRVLFDVGIAGPLAGFVIAVPALIAGLAMSRVVPLPPHFTGLSLGEPLLFKGVAWMMWGPAQEGYSLNLHPMAFAAWFGLLATALNLFPIGQLDGGHISYAVLGSRSTWVTYGAIGCAILLTFVSSSWLVWTVLIVAMLFLFGPRHPSTLDEHVPLDRGRLALAVVALVVFVVCFTPAPIEVVELFPR